MTTDEILGIGVGTELDDAVSRHVMGWGPLQDNWSPSTKIEDMLDVILHCTRPENRLRMHKIVIEYTPPVISNKKIPHDDGGGNSVIGVASPTGFEPVLPA